jgi:hypothetical protein
MAQEPLDNLLRFILNTHEEQHECIDCETCNQQFDCLAEQVALGADVHDLLPAVEAHLACCADCREEFEALVAIIRAENGGQLSQP